MAIQKRDIKILFDERIDQEDNRTIVQCWEASYTVTDSEGNTLKRVDMAQRDSTESQIQALSAFVELVDTEINTLES